MNNDSTQPQTFGTTPPPAPTPQSQSPQPQPLHPQSPQPPQSQPFQPQPFPQPQQPIPTAPTPPTSPRNKKLLIIAIAGGGSLVILVVAIILLIAFLRPDYETSYNQALTLSSELDTFVYTGHCSDVRRNVEDTSTTSKNTYDEYIDKCKDEAQELYQLVDKLGTTTGITRDSDNQELYNKFKTVFDSNAPSADRLDDTLEVYRSMHDFCIDLYNFQQNNDYQSVTPPSSFAKVTQSLTNSKSDALKQFGEGINQRYTALYEAYQKYQTALNNHNWDSSLSDNWYNASSDFSSFLRKNAPDLEESSRLAESKDYGDGSITGRFDDLVSALRKQQN